MKTKISPAVVGAFVLGAFGIGLLALLAIGSFNLFSKPERFMVYFDEAVSGLDDGSPVKLRGVRVGHVVGISIQYDRATGKSLAAVLCELNKGAISDEKGASLDVADRAALQALVDKGLRAQLELGGLATGLLFVELDFMDPAKFPDLRRQLRPEVRRDPVRPLRPVGLPGQRRDAPGERDRAPRQAAADRLPGPLHRAEGPGRRDPTRIDGVDFKGLAEQWKKTGASIDSLASAPETKEAIVNLNRTLVVLHTSLAHLDTQVDANGKDLQVTLVQAKDALESLNAAAKSARGFINAQQGFSSESNRALERVADAAESIQRLADFLERNPNALVSGRKEPK